MSERAVDNSWNDELLSAYVDGELTGSERTRVEQRLRQDPAARQLVAEFQQMATDLQALPIEAVGHDMRASILECADKALHVPFTQSRLWLWPVLAVAATLLLAIYLPGGGRDQFRLAQQVQPQEGQHPPEILAREDEDIVLEGQIAAQPEVASSLGASAPADMAAESTFSPARQGDPSAKVAVAGARAVPQAWSSRELGAAEPDYRVHVTFHQPEQFTELLTKQGLEFHIAEVGRSVADANEQSESTRPEAASVGNQSSSAAASRILVEGTPRQIEQLMAACYADQLACQSIRLAPGTTHPPSWYRGPRVGDTPGLEPRALATAQAPPGTNTPRPAIRVLFLLEAAGASHR